AVAVPQFIHRDNSPSTPSLRGTNVYAMSPAGTVDRRDAQFVWSSGITAGRFRIDVGDDGQVLYTTETAASPWPMPAALKDRLRSGSEYWWTLRGLDRGGAPATSS